MAERRRRGVLRPILLGLLLVAVGFAGYLELQRPPTITGVYAFLVCNQPLVTVVVFSDGRSQSYGPDELAALREVLRQAPEDMQVLLTGVCPRVNDTPRAIAL